MATKLLLRSLNDNGATASMTRGTGDNNLSGSARGWITNLLSTSQGSSVASNSVSSVAGPTSGVNAGDSGTNITEFVSLPLAAAATISGTITFNLRMAESMTGMNAGAQCVVQRLDSSLAVQETVINSERGTEMGTSEAAQNWTGTPTSTAFNKGDRIRVVPAFNDAGGTMASGFTGTFWWNGAAGATGDSFVTFTENLSFVSEPAGTAVYPRTTTAGINPGSANEYEAWTTAGASSTDAVTNTATGFTSPIQCTETAGGTQLEWYTKQLQALTLSGAVRVIARVLGSNSSIAQAIRCELAVCDSDGTNPTLWGEGINYSTDAAANIGTSEASFLFLVAGNDVSVSDGQRIRIRFYIDDGIAALVTGRTITLKYNGADGGNGGTKLTFSQTLTEFTGGGGFTPVDPMGQAGMFGI